MFLCCTDACMLKDFKNMTNHDYDDTESDDDDEFENENDDNILLK